MHCGIDLGSYSVKCVNGRSSWQRLVQPNRRSLFDDLPPFEWESHTAGLLRKAARECPQWSNHAVVGLQGLGCQMGYLELPHLEPEEFDTAVTAAVAREERWRSRMAPNFISTRRY